MNDTSEPLYLRDLTTRSSRVRPASQARVSLDVLRAAVDTLDGPAPDQATVASYLQQHPRPLGRAPKTIEVDGVRKTPHAWSVERGLGVYAVRDRLRDGWHQRAAVLGRRGESKRDVHARLGVQPAHDQGRRSRDAKPAAIVLTMELRAKNYPREYETWKLARYRCTKVDGPAWQYYGGAGIKFHAGWDGPDGFAAFLQHVGQRPSARHCLCRKNRNGNYEPGNVEWRLKSDVKVGTRSDRKYDEPEPERTVEIVPQRRSCSRVVVTERGSLIHLAGLTINANQADELALTLVRFADRIRVRQRAYDGTSDGGV